MPAAVLNNNLSVVNGAHPKVGVGVWESGPWDFGGRRSASSVQERGHHQSDTQTDRQIGCLGLRHGTRKLDGDGERARWPEPGYRLRFRDGTRYRTGKVARVASSAFRASDARHSRRGGGVEGPCTALYVQYAGPVQYGRIPSQSVLYRTVHYSTVFRYDKIIDFSSE